MKGLYIYSTNDSEYKSNGESKKVLSQYQAFKDAGVDMELVDIILGSKIHKLLYRLPAYGVYPKASREKILSKIFDVDFVYIRKNIFDGSYYKLLKELKDAKPDLSTIVEIPTYPYLSEWSRLVDKPLILKERRALPIIQRDRLVDCYTTLSDDDELFGVETIRFNNCITVEDYKPKQSMQDSDEIHLIGVALLARWHGYDRVIEGMRNYYDTNPEKKVYFHIVGEGTELPTLKRLAEKSRLDPYIHFEGKLFGDALDALYDRSNVGIGSLGLYRIGLESGKTLKSREYCAKGIPFIQAASDSTFDGFPYCLNFENDNTPIDINRIIKFADEIDYNAATQSMRKYAETELSWNSYINRITNRVKEKDIAGGQQG